LLLYLILLFTGNFLCRNGVPAVEQGLGKRGLPPFLLFSVYPVAFPSETTVAPFRAWRVSFRLKTCGDRASTLEKRLFSFCFALPPAFGSGIKRVSGYKAPLPPQPSRNNFRLQGLLKITFLRLAVF